MASHNPLPSTAILDQMLADLARTYRGGRLLLIATTNLDAQLPVIWNIDEQLAAVAERRTQAPRLQPAGQVGRKTRQVFPQLLQGQVFRAHLQHHVERPQSLGHPQEINKLKWIDIIGVIAPARLAHLGRLIAVAACHQPFGAWAAEMDFGPHVGRPGGQAGRERISGRDAARVVQAVVQGVDQGGAAHAMGQRQP